ncbi:MAG: dialkylresorcinol condensing enzyme DarA [Flavobacteriales bacterium]|nr:dialkylresorcinol condensing enzyme DarA [Flavobacteriales bacterium]
MKARTVIHYSQTGQLTEVLRSLCAPLTEAGITVDHMVIEPSQPFAFPWSRMRFFGAFPEAVNGDPVDLKPFAPPAANYDLVILGYTIWFLNPSIPINSFLKHPASAAILKDKPVLTVIGARNMWVHAQQKVRGLVAGLGGRVVGNILAEDRSPNMVSLVTIIRWMFYGRKDPFLVFPAAGIRAEDIAGMSRFGPVRRRTSGPWKHRSSERGTACSGSSRIKPSLLVLEKRALVLFVKYRNYILAKVARDPASRERRVSVFSVVLPIGAFILSPITALATVLLSLVKGKELAREIEELQRY